jgi:hypothetical protein
MSDQPLTPASAMRERHLVELAGKRIRCDSCRDPASLFMRCMVCRRILARCGTHERGLSADRDACCR